jgi:hypothetical protein
MVIHISQSICIQVQPIKIQEYHDNQQERRGPTTAFDEKLNGMRFLTLSVDNKALSVQHLVLVQVSRSYQCKLMRKYRTS